MGSTKTGVREIVNVRGNNHRPPASFVVFFLKFEMKQAEAPYGENRMNRFPWCFGISSWYFRLPTGKNTDHV